MVPLAPSRLDELRKRYEENPRRFFAPLANEYRKAGDLDQAITLCQTHLDEQPGNMNGHVVYGQALFDAGRYEEAQTTFATALGLDPENLIALRHLGDISRLTSDAPKAIEWYTRVLEADPRNEEILAFISELKSVAAAPPPPKPTPPATPAVEPPAAAVVAEPVARSRPSQAATPIVPVETIPAKRPSVPLMDVELDFGDGPATPAEPAAPPGDLDFTGFGAPTTAPDADATQESAPAGGDLTFDSGLGWDLPVESTGPEPGTAPDESEPPATPEVFVTETMAELYLQQGFRDEALDVYRKLAEQNPDDPSIRERIESLEKGGRSSVSFDRISDAMPEVAPGTDALVPMNEPAPVATPADGLELEPMALDSLSDTPATEVVPTPAEPTPAEPTPAEPTSAIDDLAFDDVVGVVTPALDKVVPALHSARGYFAALAQRRAVRSDGTAPAGIAAVENAPPPAQRDAGSVDALFGGQVPDAADDAMGRALATAVGTGDAAAPIRGRPTQPAGSELSLDSVFRGESAMRSSGPIARQSQHLKFDQFFSADEAASSPPAAPADPAAAPADPAAAPADPAAAPADDAQFQNWLQGLKGQ